ncbi:hypothetical protein LAZ67_1001241 [Cordylochernes scorpioides]|uniref:Major facilitator superfamily (MFS) profile domain-containing protein n=1 Tax=Cordylochernes scorpioides TaxID=51811 RepID=A0ABY6JVE2_9ARAC|nr:hypothetical protein LAZ67_1001241 [Cordylochernes scorpioides]
MVSLMIGSIILNSPEQRVVVFYLLQWELVCERRPLLSLVTYGQGTAAAIGALMWGALGDRAGRKYPLLVALVLHTASAVALHFPPALPAAVGLLALESFFAAFEDDKLQALLDEDDAVSLGITRQDVPLRLNPTGKVQTERKWLPHGLGEKNKEIRTTISEILMERFQRTSFLHRIVIGYENGSILTIRSVRNHGYVQDSLTTSTAKSHGKKILLCIRWVQYGVLKPGVTAHRHQQQLTPINIS